MPIHIDELRRLKKLILETQIEERVTPELFDAYVTDFILNHTKEEVEAANFDQEKQDRHNRVQERLKLELQDIIQMTTCEMLPIACPGMKIARGDIVTVFGSHNDAKTGTLLQCAIENAIKGKRVLYLSYEGNFTDMRTRAQQIFKTYRVENINLWDNLKLMDANDCYHPIKYYKDFKENLLKHFMRIDEYDLVIVDTIDKILRHDADSPNRNNTRKFEILEDIVLFLNDYISSYSSIYPPIVLVKQLHTKHVWSRDPNQIRKLHENSQHGTTFMEGVTYSFGVGQILQFEGGKKHMEFFIGINKARNSRAETGGAWKLILAKKQNEEKEVQTIELTKGMTIPYLWSSNLPRAYFEIRNQNITAQDLFWVKEKKVNNVPLTQQQVKEI